MFGMVKYLSRFVLQMLPSITATVIGAYIVATYVNPRNPPDSARTAAQTRPAEKPVAKAEPTGPADATDVAASADDKPVDNKAAETKPVETKSLETKPVEAAEKPEKAKPVKAASAPAAPSDVRVIPLAKPSTAPAEVQAVQPTAQPAASQAAHPVASEERKDANDLARAAIQRLRSNPETREASKDASRPGDEAGRGVPSVRASQVRVGLEQPQATPALIPASAPPLPPAINIGSPRYPQADDTTATASVRTDGRDDIRLTPPGEVPTVREPLDLRAANSRTTSAAANTNTSVADDFLSATKSFFRAITPN